MTTFGYRTCLPVLAALALSGCVVAQPVGPGPAVVGGGYGYDGYDGYDGLPSDYYGQLHSYGAWQTVPGYGSVWCPSVASAWSPYLYGPAPSWGFTFYFGDWIHTPYGWGWVPGRHHHPHWHRWAHRGHPYRWDDRRHGRHDRDHWDRNGRNGRDWDDRDGRGRDGWRADGWRGNDRRERFVNPTPPRRTWSPGVTEPRTTRIPDRAPRGPASRPRLERPGIDDARGRGGRGVTPSRPDGGFRPPVVPITEPPRGGQGWGGRGGHGVRVDAPRRVTTPRVNAPQPTVRSLGGPGGAAPRSRSFGGGSGGRSSARPRVEVRGGDRGSAPAARGQQRGRW